MIKFIENKDEKRKISREVLEALTEWFEVEESREQYIRESADQPFWAYFDNDVPSGFLCLKETGNETMELAVMGVKKECHRKGAGRRLFAAAKDYAAKEGYHDDTVTSLGICMQCREDFKLSGTQNLNFVNRIIPQII